MAYRKIIEDVETHPRIDVRCMYAFFYILKPENIEILIDEVCAWRVFGTKIGDVVRFRRPFIPVILIRPIVV